jgi:transposase InsO family protein
MIYRFDVPNCIITDHGTNITRKKFLDFCDGYGIRIDWALVRHPRTNGQVERANGMRTQALHLRLTQKVCRAMGCRGPNDPLEPKNDPKPVHGVHPFLPRIRSQSSVVLRPRSRHPKSKGLRPRPNHGGLTGRGRPTRGGL